MENDLLTPAEFAALVGATPRTVERWRTRATGPTYLKIGGRVRYRRADVDQWIATRAVAPS